MYQTKQKILLEKYLKDNAQKQFTINEIIESVCPDNKGKSTIYRLISNLTRSGTLIKLQGEDSKSILYQYIGEGTDCHSHFHLKCSMCGKLFHLDCEHIDEITKHISSEHNFNLDMMKTVLYGTCKECSEVRK